MIYEKAIKHFLDGYGVYKGVFSLCKSLINNFKHAIDVKYRDINEIFKDVQSGSININDIIETNGFLLEYGQIFKPYTHINTMFGNCALVNKKSVISNAKPMEQVTMELNATIFQPPVQKIPSYDDLGCGFLYDTRFKGFEHEMKDSSFIIDDYAKPIFLIYNKNKYFKYINKEVSIRARVIKIPDQVISNLSYVCDETINCICSNYINLYSENKSFICLIVMDDETFIKEPIDINNLADINAPLYAECELGEFMTLCQNSKLEPTTILSEIVPFLPQKVEPHCPFKIMNSNNIGNAFVSTGNIYTVFREPNIVGFYTTMKLFDHLTYENKIKNYSTVVSNFAIDYKNLTKKLFGKKQSMSLNFLFDYSKQHLFDSRGVLYSKTVDNIIGNDDSQKYIQNWLKNTTV